MNGFSAGLSVARGVALLALAGGLSGCGTLGLFGASDPAPVAVQQADAQPAADAGASGTIRVNMDPESECPQVRVPPGMSAYSVSGGGAVRYQASIVDMARECILQPGNRIQLKVGVRGMFVASDTSLGGTMSAPMRITVQDRAGNVMASKVQKVSGTVIGGTGQARFQYVDDSIIVPISGKTPLASYDIFVGFDKKGQ